MLHLLLIILLSFADRSYDELYDKKGAAHYLNTTERHVRRLAQDRRLAHVKVGHFVRFRRSDLDRYLERRRVLADER